MTGNWKSILRLEKNKNGRDFVCGDIHGCFDDMAAELNKVNFDKTRDRLFCVGDLIDRGPRSELAAYYLTCGWLFAVLGNHEWMFLMAHCDFPDRDRYCQSHINNGGAWAYKDKHKAESLFWAADSLPLIIQIDDTLIAHATIPEVKNLESIEKYPHEYIKTTTWHREAYPPLHIPGINRVYVGHSIVKEPVQSGKYINIDTGAFLKHYQREGKLTILEIKKEK